jgi:hypothetical protein
VTCPPECLPQQRRLILLRDHALVVDIRNGHLDVVLHVERAVAALPRGEVVEERRGLAGHMPDIDQPVDQPPGGASWSGSTCVAR